MTDRRSFITAALAAPIALAAPVVASPAFDPAAWIKHFLAVGGTINIQADGAYYGYAPENEEVVALVMDCHRAGHWPAVRAYANSMFGKA